VRLTLDDREPPKGRVIALQQFQVTPDASPHHQLPGRARPATGLGASLHDGQQSGLAHQPQGASPVFMRTYTPDRIQESTAQ
jgi:hypothetical protein